MSAVAMPAVDVTVDGLDVSVYEIPTDAPESDGTLRWDSTTIVVVEADAGDRTGIGYTYGPPAIAAFIDGQLADVVVGADALAPRATWAQMQSAIRNAGRDGVGAMAVSAVDNALWDLAARLLGLPLVRLLGQIHEHANVYGSGGFCSYDRQRLQEQLAGWAQRGIGRVKMKVGREPGRDRERVAWAREAIGDDVALMVDANGANRPTQALAWGAPVRRAGRRVAGGAGLLRRRGRHGARASRGSAGS